MMQAFKTSLALSTLLFSGLLFADNPPPTNFDLTVVNNSDSAFTYITDSGENPGNVFNLDQTVILPHTTTHIHGSITQNFDLCANLIFRDDKGKDDSLLILDPRAFHINQPILDLGSADYSLQVNNKIVNPNEAPMGLYLSAATVTINNGRAG